MAIVAYSATKHTKQKTAHTNARKAEAVTVRRLMKEPTGGEVGAKRQTSSEIRGNRETRSEIDAKQQARSEVGTKRETRGEAGVKYDQGKPDYSLLTSAMLEPMTQALMYGERKYARGNFRAGFQNVRLTSAAMRHILAYLNREDNDPESGVSHLGHAMAALAMLLDNIAEGVSTDVRYEKKEGLASVGRGDSANLSHTVVAEHTARMVPGGHARQSASSRTKGRGTR